MSTKRTAASRPQWENAAVSHSKSKLLQLPAELQIVVLRELLVSEQPIGRRDTYLAPMGNPRSLRRTPRSTKNPYATSKKQPKKVSGYHLYPQVLSTCQVFRAAGQSILYNENRLQIDCDTGSNSLCYCGYNCHTQTNAKITMFPSYGQILAIISPSHNRFNFVNISAEQRTFAMKFGRYYLNMRNRTGPASLNGFPSASGTFRLLIVADLASIFSGKDLVVDVTSEMDSSITGEDRNQQMDGVKALQSLRCKSIKFFKKVGDEKVYDMVQKIVEGSTRVVDLRDALQNVQAIESPLFHMVKSNSSRGNALENKLKKLADAVYAYDIQKFSKLRNEITDTFKEETQKLSALFESDDDTVANAVNQEKDEKASGTVENAK